MIKVLILAYDFPPYVSVGGLRPYSWFQYFYEFDIQPIVVTRQWSNKHGNHLDYVEKSEYGETIIEKTNHGIIIRTPYVPNLANKMLLKYGENKFRLHRKIISAYYEFFQWIFPIGPKARIYQEARKYLKFNKVDVIIATGDPFILFLYANKLSRKFAIPWIADYRDPWTNGATNEKNKFLAFFLSFFEKKIIKTTSAVTTVSDFFSNKISNVVNNQNFQVIPNGYNPDNIENCKYYKQNNKILNIGFAGTILENESLISFLEVLNTTKIKYPQFEFQMNFYGTNRNEEIQSIINSNYNLITPFCKIVPKLPNEKLLPILSTCNVLLLFNYHYSIGTKIYEYIALKRRILFCFRNNYTQINHTGLKINYITKSPQIALIEKTNSGTIVEDKEHLYEVLNDLFKEFSETGQIACHSKDISEYSRRAQTEKLAKLIHEILKK